MLGEKSVVKIWKFLTSGFLGIMFRVRLAISSFICACLLQQLIHNRWPFSRLLAIEEVIKKGLALSYTAKFDRQLVDSSIRPWHVGCEDRSQKLQDKSPAYFPEAGLVELANVLVDMPTCLHRCQGWTLRQGLLDVVCLTNPLYLGAFITLPWKRPAPLAGGVLLGLPFMKNYYHWLLEVMPRIQMIEHEPQFAGLPWILPADCPGFVRNLLNTAGYGDRVVYLERGTYRFERLVVPTVLSDGNGANHPSEISWLRQTFLPQPLPQATRRIFLSRRDAKIRFITNEQAIFQELEPLGFEWVCPGSLSFLEQVQLFAEAEMIVGPHGAGFANIVFAPATSGFVEVFGSDHFSDCYSQIARVRNTPYGIVVGEPDGLGIRVNPARLKETLNLVLRAMNQQSLPAR
jgi:Glycosyltransferase 61